MDDFNSGERGVEEEFTMYREIKTCLEEAGFGLRKWSSASSAEFIKKIRDGVGEEIAQQWEEDVKKDGH